MRNLALSFIVLVVSSVPAFAQPVGYNYDEAKVPKFDLPDPLKSNDGTRVTTAREWRAKRRPEVVALFEEHVYGKPLALEAPVRTEVLEEGNGALGGIADRRQVRYYFTTDKSGPSMDILIYTPAGKKSVPAFVGLNFRGNHTVTDDPAVLISQSWMRPGDGVVDNRATEASRGTSKSRWAIETIVKRGYGVATIYYGDIDPDFDDGWENGVHAVVRKPKANEWGSIATWAWGLSRALDYFERDERIDATKVAVLGHSRLGKTSLWAGASDERFALVISNDSGCGGAALSRRRFGETVKRINTSFPHWFNDNFNRYNDNEDALPVDQHMLIALMAPRPVYVASAVDDQWADPNGEFLSAYHAGPVYRLFGKPVLESPKQPAVDRPVMTQLGYHIRTGKHDVTDFDWGQYLTFADRFLK